MSDGRAKLRSVVFYSERARLRELEQREAAGENVWIDYFPRQSLMKIGQIWMFLQADIEGGYGPSMSGLLVNLFLRDLGEPPIAKQPHELPQVATDLRPADPVLNLIEGICEVTQTHSSLDVNDVAAELNAIMHSYRIAYKLIDGQIVPFRSDPVYSSTIEPTVRLLIGKRFAPAQSAYLKALQEIRVNDPGDAIVDAGVALQETFTSLGYEEGTLGRQLVLAKKSGLLSGHDVPLGKALEAAITWASADRSETGSAHKVTNATLDDAWLTIQIVGALILRLAADAPRSTIPDV